MITNNLNNFLFGWWVSYFVEMECVKWLHFPNKLQQILALPSKFLHCLTICYGLFNRKNDLRVIAQPCSHVEMGTKSEGKITILEKMGQTTQECYEAFVNLSGQPNLFHVFTSMDANVCIEARDGIEVRRCAEVTILFLVLAFTCSNLWSEATL